MDFANECPPLTAEPFLRDGVQRAGRNLPSPLKYPRNEILDKRLPKKVILRRRNDVNKLFRNGNKISSGNISAFYLPSFSRKIAFHISAKVGISIIRNKIKRYLRESYRLNKHLFPENISIIFRVSKPIISPSYQSIEFDMRNIASEILSNNEKD